MGQRLKHLLFYQLVLFLTFITSSHCYSANQTPTFSPILPGTELPFKVEIRRGFKLPFGIQSYASAKIDGKILIIGGRINGLHGFNNDPLNFPPNQQNYFAIVIDVIPQKVYYRSWFDSPSGLNIDQIQSLSVTSPQFYQDLPKCPCHRAKPVETLYMTGGYGYRTAAQNFTTFPFLTAIDIEGLMHWVIEPDADETAAQYIRQYNDPMLAVTGGFMDQIGDKENPTLLCLGQDFEGPYFFGNNAQFYTEQIRKFFILDNGVDLWVDFLEVAPFYRNPTFRRRDLNICRVIRPTRRGRRHELVAFGGVFTETNGVWTIPIVIQPTGAANMLDPFNPDTFKQGMQQYACANFGLYSRSTGDMYNILMGGITAEYLTLNGFVEDTEFPFTDQVTAIKSNRRNEFTQYFLSATYPMIRSTGPNQGNPLLFGAGAQFFTVEGIRKYAKNVIRLDRIKEKTLVGHIIGGIQSSLMNTNTQADSAASPYVFQVFVEPQ
ncbi:MAG: hypothetical protein Q8K60_08045 [Parachlamydiaceae bacterium]|nr:hypothetical protein [Parachlamydiaceae bacterium]